ncbi:oligosaccharide flippase family protein [Paraflavitalea pollutisoli]|uniref:oligosaccharide flippase family protein n=1 Tax=Paraflavitalea pollutisoli TaxID=3034143 RepID=UPI0023ED8408|nr:oligosaccharide flippase family protein [Paraflavitalea sp. H1-2-19X]
MANLKKNLVYNFLLSISQVLIPLVSIPYIARVLDPEGIGRVSFIDSFTYYFIAIAEFGIVVYGVRAISRARSDQQLLHKTVSELLVLHLVTSCCALLLYSIAVMACWYKIQDMRLLLFSLSFLLVNGFACEWYFWGQERFRYITIRSLLTRGLGLLSIFLLVRRPEQYYLYYGIIVCSAIANLVWNRWTLFREVPIRFRQVNWQQHIPHTLVTFLISLFAGIPLLLDNVLLGLVGSTAAVGIYAFSVKIARIVSALFTDAFLVLYPRTVALIEQQDQSGMQAVILKSVQLLTLLAIPAGAGLYLLADPFVQVFLGSRFGAVAANLRIIALFPLLKGWGVLLSKQVLVAHDQEKLFLRSLVAGSILFVGFTLVLSYYFADQGACIALLLSEGVVLAMNYYYIRQRIGALRLFDWKTAGNALIGSLVFVPIVYGVRLQFEAPAMVLMVSVVLCIPAYFGLQLFVLRNTFVRAVYQGGWAYFKA